MSTKKHTCWVCGSTKPGQWNSASPDHWCKVTAKPITEKPGREHAFFICSRRCYGDRAQSLDYLVVAGWQWKKIETVIPDPQAMPPGKQLKLGGDNS